MMLETQAQFEEMWNGLSPFVRPSDNGFLVYFTAAWCGPCQKLNFGELSEIAKSRGLTLWKCEETVNKYTAGYCGVRSYPTFVFFTPKKVESIYKSNITEEVADWVMGL